MVDASSCFHFILPISGKDGINQARDIKIHLFIIFFLFSLLFIQYGILGNDTRFQRHDHLFYALSIFEIHRVKVIISAGCKKVKGQDVKVKNVHLYFKKL